MYCFGRIIHMRLYHGSKRIVKEPAPGFGNFRNDFGEGFYCTDDRMFAGGWAAADGTNGIINSYTVDTSGLNILRLGTDFRSVLLWLRILMEHRAFRSETLWMDQRFDWIQRNVPLETEGYDILVGPAADDSRFSFAQRFLCNQIPLEDLSIVLSGTALQYVLRSPEAFDALEFKGFEMADAKDYITWAVERDHSARNAVSDSGLDGLFMSDLLRRGMTFDDPRLQ